MYNFVPQLKFLKFVSEEFPMSIFSLLCAHDQKQKFPSCTRTLSLHNIKFLAVISIFLRTRLELGVRAGGITQGAEPRVGARAGGILKTMFFLNIFAKSKHFAKPKIKY